MSFYTEFGKSNEKYRKFRPAYPDALFIEIMNNCKGGFKRAIDLGAGTGLSTVILSQKFEKVYAVEPDKNMVAEFEKVGNNVEIFRCSSEEFDLSENDVDLVTIGNAFYWMKGETVISKINRWLRNGGILATYRYNMPTTVPDIDKIILEEDQKWDEFRHERLRDEEYSIRTIRNSNLFSDIQLKKVKNIINLEVEELIGFFSSTSYVSAYLRTMNDPDNYITNLTESIKSMASGKIPVDFSLELIIARKWENEP